MASYLSILLVGLVYIISFGALSFLRRQGLSMRFAIEGLVITALGVGLSYFSVPFHPLLFLIFLYLITMRGRLLVDIATWLSSSGRDQMAISLMKFAVHLSLDPTTKRIVHITQGMALLRMENAVEAYRLLSRAMSGMDEYRFGAKYLAAGYYNLGLACRRTNREAEALNRFKKAIDAWPRSIYAQAAERELEKSKFG